MSDIEKMIEEAFEKRWNNLYRLDFEFYSPDEHYSYTPNEVRGWLKEGAKFMLEYVKQCEARKRAIDYVCDKRGW